MRKLAKFFLIGLFGVVFNLIPLSALAEEVNDESKGQAGFYGTYEPETEEEKNQIEDKDKKNASSPAAANKRTTFGRSRLPNTGEADTSGYMYSGAVLCLCIGITYFNKRKGEFSQ